MRLRVARKVWKRALYGWPSGRVGTTRIAQHRMAVVHERAKRRLIAWREEKQRAVERVQARWEELRLAEEMYRPK